MVRQTMPKGLRLPQSAANDIPFIFEIDNDFKNRCKGLISLGNGCIIRTAPRHDPLESSNSSARMDRLLRPAPVNQRRAEICAAFVANFLPQLQKPRPALIAA